MNTPAARNTVNARGRSTLRRGECMASVRNGLRSTVALASRAGVEAVGGEAFDFETDVAEGGLGCVEGRFDPIGVDPESQGHRDDGGIPELQVLVAVGHGSVTAEGYVAARPICINAVGVTLEDFQAGENARVVGRAGQLSDATAPRKATSAA